MTDNSECTGSASGEHSWCPCFGSCPCNRAECIMCDASRPLTDAEIKAKRLSASTSTGDTA